MNYEDLSLKALYYTQNTHPERLRASAKSFHTNIVTPYCLETKTPLIHWKERGVALTAFYNSLINKGFIKIQQGKIEVDFNSFPQHIKTQLMSSTSSSSEKSKIYTILDDDEEYVTRTKGTSEKQSKQNDLTESNRIAFCPIQCGKSLAGMSETQINVHIDECLTQSLLQEEQSKKGGSSYESIVDLTFSDFAIDDDGPFKVVCPFPSCGVTTPQKALEFVHHFCNMHQNEANQAFVCPICLELGECDPDMDTQQLNLLKHVYSIHQDLVNTGLTTSTTQSNTFTTQILPQTSFTQPTQPSFPQTTFSPPPQQFNFPTPPVNSMQMFMTAPDTSHFVSPPNVQTMSPHLYQQIRQKAIQQALQPIQSSQPLQSFQQPQPVYTIQAPASNFSFFQKPLPIVHKVVPPISTPNTLESSFLNRLAQANPHTFSQIPPPPFPPSTIPTNPSNSFQYPYTIINNNNNTNLANTSTTTTTSTSATSTNNTNYPSATNTATQMPRRHGKRYVNKHQPTTQQTEVTETTTTTSHTLCPAKRQSSTEKTENDPVFLVQILDSNLDEECSICLDEFTKGSRIARLECLCIFHESCINEWFEKKKHCPLHEPAKPC